MAKHIMGGHVAIGPSPYVEGQYEQAYGKCAHCREPVNQPHTEHCLENPNRDALREKRQRERGYSEEEIIARRKNSTFIALGAHQPIKYRSHQLLDSERGR